MNNVYEVNQHVCNYFDKITTNFCQINSMIIAYILFFAFVRVFASLVIRVYSSYKRRQTHVHLSASFGLVFISHNANVDSLRDACNA